MQSKATLEHGEVAQGPAVSVPSPESDSSVFRGRPVTGINIRIPAEEFLVYYFLTRDHIRCDRSGKVLNGSNEAGFLFQSFADAEAFARSVADISPRIGSGIYNSSWKIVAEFFNDDFVRQQARANAPSRLFLWAGALLISGSVFMWIEVRSGWTVTFGFLIGSRLILSGVLKFARGVYGLNRSTTHSS